MIFLGPARNIVIKPFILLGYLEICAMFFSVIGIICGIVGLIFYHPYLYLSDKIMSSAHAAPLRSATIHLFRKRCPRTHQHPGRRRRLRLTPSIPEPCETRGSSLHASPAGL